MVVGVTLFLCLIFSGVIRNVFEAVTFKPRPGKPGQSFKDVSQACSWLRKVRCKGNEGHSAHLRNAKGSATKFGE